jgi:hypothetical protein
MRKCTALLLITCLVVSSLIVYAVTPVTAQIGYKPSVPQFTVKFVDESVGYGIARTTEFTIKNQPFTPYTDANGDTYNLYYTAQYRINSSDEQGWIGFYYQPYIQSDSQYTTKWRVFYDFDEGVFGSRMEFRVKAEIGCLKNYYNTDGYMIVGSNFTVVVSSGWSGIQTATATDELWSPPPSQTVTSPPLTSYPTTQKPSTSNKPNTDNPNLFGFASWVGVAVVVLLSAIVVLLVLIAVAMWRKNVSQFNSSLNTSVVDG